MKCHGIGAVVWHAVRLQETGTAPPAPDTRRGLYLAWQSHQVVMSLSAISKALTLSLPHKCSLGTSSTFGRPYISRVITSIRCCLKATTHPWRRHCCINSYGWRPMTAESRTETDPQGSGFQTASNAPLATTRVKTHRPWQE
jgi:hypothetical protein